MIEKIMFLVYYDPGLPVLLPLLFSLAILRPEPSMANILSATAAFPLVLYKLHVTGYTIQYIAFISIVNAILGLSQLLIVYPLEREMLATKGSSIAAMILPLYPIGRSMVRQFSGLPSSVLLTALTLILAAIFASITKITGRRLVVPYVEAAMIVALSYIVYIVFTL